MKLILTLVAVLLFGVLITVLLYGKFAQMAAAEDNDWEAEWREERILSTMESLNEGTPSYVDAIDYDTEFSPEAQAALALIQHNGGEGHFAQYFPLIINGNIHDKEKLKEHAEMLAKKDGFTIISSIDEIPEKDRDHRGLELTLLDFTKTYKEEDGIDTITFEALKRSNRDKGAYYFFYSAHNPWGFSTTYKVKLVDGKWELLMQGWIAMSCG